MSTPQIRYSNIEFETMKQNILQLIPQLSQNWTDFNETDLGIVLINLFCGIGDMLAYYLDKRANEAYLSTAKLRSSVLRLIKALDYSPKRKVGAITTLKFSLSSPLSRTVTIPKYTICSTKGGVRFVTTELAQIPAGQTEVTVTATQGDLKIKTFAATGDALQKYNLENTSVANNFLDVYVGETLWQEDKNYPILENDTLLYKVELDENDNTYIVFSSMIGEVPLKNQLIEVYFLETLGEDGNVQAGLITEIISEFTDSDLLTVTNTEDAKHGRDKESIAEIQINAPRSLRTLWRAVNREDYENLALQFDGIAKAKAVPASNLWKLMYVYIAPEGGGTANSTLKNTVKEFLSERNDPTVDIEIKDPDYVGVTLEIDVVVKSGYRNSAVQSTVEQKCNEYFSFDNQKFGGGLTKNNTLGINVDEDESGIQLGDIYQLVESIEGVRYCTIKVMSTDGTQTANNLEFEETQIPYLQNLTVNVVGGI